MGTAGLGSGSVKNPCCGKRVNHKISSLFSSKKHTLNRGKHRRWAAGPNKGWAEGNQGNMGVNREQMGRR